MAITNAMIISNAQFDLMEAGKIGTTGRMITYRDEDGEHTMPEPEEIHTFARWKALGYSVKKGQHAVAQLRIWKCAKETAELTGPDPKTGEPVTISEEVRKMFMKTAFFFSASQVEPTKDRKTA